MKDYRRKRKKIARDIVDFKVIGSARILVEAKKMGILRSNIGDALSRLQECAAGFTTTLCELP